MTISKISPLKQSGSWQLEEYLVITGKPSASRPESYPIEIMQMQPYRQHFYGSYRAASPCEAAHIGIKAVFGGRSEEAREFEKHYACENEGQSHRGTKITDLEGTPGSTAFEVYLGRKHINTVYFDSDMSTDDVRRSLIEHDHLHPAIRVYRARVATRGRGVGDLPSWAKR